MISSIHVYVGAVHSKISESVWEKMGSEMSKLFNCDMVISNKESELLNTKLSIDGKMTPKEAMKVQRKFESYLE